jgi:hypothetical protein
MPENLIVGIDLKAQLETYCVYFYHNLCGLQFQKLSIALDKFGYLFFQDTSHH